ncbi:MAG: hypothetical protein ACK559_34695, partial [bacterium]
LGRRVEEPDVAVVGPVVAAARPPRAAALEEHLAAVGRGRGGAAEGVGQAPVATEAAEAHRGVEQADGGPVGEELLAVELRVVVGHARAAGGGAAHVLVWREGE